MKKTVLLGLVLVLMALLQGCAYARGTVVAEGNGILRDTIYSYDLYNNGKHRVWMTHDDVSVFCTDNEELGLKAKNLLLNHDGEVVITYSSPSLYSRDWCWSPSNTAYGEGAEPPIVWRLDDIYAVPARK